MSGDLLARWLAERVRDDQWEAVRPFGDVAAARQLAQTHLRGDGPDGLWWEMTSGGARFYLPRSAYVEAVAQLVAKGMAPTAAEIAGLDVAAPWTAAGQVTWSQVVRARRGWRPTHQGRLALGPAELDEAV